MINITFLIMIAVLIIVLMSTYLSENYIILLFLSVPLIFLIFDSSNIDKKNKKEQTKVKIFVLKLSDDSEYKSLSKIEVKKENGIYKAKYEEEKGKFKELEFTSDYTLEVKQKKVLKGELK